MIEDLEPFFGLYQSPGMEFIEPLDDYKTEQEKLTSYIKNRYPFYGYGMWTVLDKATGQVIGRAGIEEREIDGVETTELGYMLHYLYRRNGIGLELCQKILEYAKDVLCIEEIHAYTHKDNIASKRLLEKLDFQLQGEVQQQGRVLLKYWRKL